MLKKLLIILACTNTFLRADRETEFKSNKCKTFQNLQVCNALNVAGNETVVGSVTANSFINSSGLLVNGLRSYAVLSNQTEITSGSNVLWAATPAGNLSSNITFDPTTGLITLPTSGLFLVKYSVRIDLGLTSPSSIIQLQQTVAGTPTNISQPAITHDIEDGETAPAPHTQSQLTGYALIAVTSTANNIINLVVTLNPDSDVIPATTGTDANAQIAILQLK